MAGERRSARPEMTAADKILWHRAKVSAWLAGEPILPVTLELGLTTRCDRSCADCPSRAGRPGLDLPLDVAGRLLAFLEGGTRGLIVTGGEPTLHPDFGRVLAAARRRDFLDVSVITNGERLDREEISGPLVAHASAVRVSLYGWTDRSLDGVAPTLRRIEGLRRRIDAEKSPLRIGVSALTGGADPAAIGGVLAAARGAGAHWAYLHPTCVTAPDGTRRSAGETIEAGSFPVYRIDERFSDTPLSFRGYHAAHFVLVAAADGKTYLSSETKFDPSYALDDLSRDFERSFRSDARRERIAAVTSDRYSAGGGRNRGVVYSHLLETLRDDPGRSREPRAREFLLPHVI